MEIQLTKEIMEQVLSDMTLLNPCEKCQGDGYTVIEVNMIAYGKNAGTEECIVEDCTDCKGTGSACGEVVLFLQERLRDMKRDER